jgi:hypothetical protein
MKKLILIMTILVVGLVGCKKDDPTKTELLTQETWINSSVIVDANKNQKPDDEAGASQDISFKFNDDGSLVYIKNQNTKYLNWAFENNESSIKIIGIMDELLLPPITEQTFQIYLLDENSLIFYFMSTADNPETGTFVIYRHN